MPKHASAFLDELLARGAVPRALIDAAIERARAEQLTLSAALVREGAPPNEVLDALSATVGVPRAPATWLRAPPADAAAGLDKAILWRAGIAPLGVHDGQLVLAYMNPEDVEQASELGLPPHRAVLALEADVRQVLWAVVGPPPAADTVLVGTQLPDASGLPPTEALLPAELPAPPSVASQEAPFSARAAVSSQEGMIAARLDEFEIGRALGKGGMAIVYAARERATGRPVALKRMNEQLSEDEYFIERFRREAKSAQSIAHPNVVSTLGLGFEGGTYFLVTELVEGGSVAGLLHRMGAMPAALAARVIGDVLLGLEAAHQKGVLHRDLKPANLLVSSSGLVKIGDFGIAKDQSSSDKSLTHTGLLVGTPSYMSPEQVQCEPLDPRSDLFSAGVVLYELLTGQNPFDAEKVSSILFKVAAARPPHIFEACPDVPALLERVVLGLLARSREDRYPSAAAALADLEPFLLHLQATRPHLVQEALKDPPGVQRQLLEEHAAAEVARAKSLLATGGAQQKSQAAIALVRARASDPSSPEAPALLEQLCADGQLYFGPPRDKRIAETLAAIAEQAEPAPGLLRRAAELYRAEGNVYRAALFLKRYLLERPDDSHAATQLAALIGGGESSSPFAPLSTVVKLSATGITDGIKTGGWRAPEVREAPAPAPMLVMRADDGDVSEAGLLAYVQAFLRTFKRPLLSLGGVIVVGWLLLTAVDAFIERSKSDIDGAFKSADVHAASAAAATNARLHAKQRAAHLEKARAFKDALKPERAIKHYESALRAHPLPEERAALLLEAAGVYETLGRGEEAAQARDEAAKLGGD